MYRSNNSFISGRNLEWRVNQSKGRIARSAAILGSLALACIALGSNYAHATTLILEYELHSGFSGNTPFVISQKNYNQNPANFHLSHAARFGAVREQWAVTTQPGRLELHVDTVSNELTRFIVEGYTATLNPGFSLGNSISLNVDVDLSKVRSEAVLNGSVAQNGKISARTLTDINAFGELQIDGAHGSLLFPVMAKTGHVGRPDSCSLCFGEWGDYGGRQAGFPIDLLPFQTNPAGQHLTIFNAWLGLGRDTTGRFDLTGSIFDLNSYLVFLGSRIDVPGGGLPGGGLPGGGLPGGGMQGGGLPGGGLPGGGMQGGGMQGGGVPIPEPGSLLLFGAALAGASMVKQRATRSS